MSWTPALAPATLTQGAVVAAGVVAVLFGLLTWMTALDFSPAVVAVSAATAYTTPAITYLQRTYVDPYLQIRRLVSSPGPSRRRRPGHPQTVETP